MTNKRRAFQDWEFEQIQNEFGYKRHYKNFSLLNAWQTCQELISPDETKRLEVLSERLFYAVETWNEDELKLFFISPLIDLVSFEHEQYKPFAQRKFSATLGEWQVSGIVDLLVATGIQHPARPFFFLHEYKQEHKRDNDPLGQLLIGMLVAQQLNKDEQPLYGCYVVGRYYFFVVLKGQEYSVSRSYDGSLMDDLRTIFRMFRFVRRYIEASIERQAMSNE